VRYVLDCSVAIKWLVPEVDSDLAERWLEREQAGEIAFLAPDVLVAELGHTVRKHVLRGGLTANDAHSGLAEFLSMRIDFSPSLALAPQALSLALGHVATFYDALYVALAQREGVPVLTADARMAGAFSGLGRILTLGPPA